MGRKTKANLFYTRQKDRYKETSFGITLKQCSCCGIWKPLHENGEFSAFSFDTSTNQHKPQCKYCLNKGSKKWSKENPEESKAYNANRKAMEMALPHSENSKEWKTVLKEFGEKCALTGTTKDIHLEHFIPISWGYGGSLRNNIYPLVGYLNLSKNAKNPFEWYKTLTKEERKKFYVLVGKLAEENEMSIGEFKEYVYWCEANKRTVEQVQADNMKGLTGIDLWKMSLEN